MVGDMLRLGYDRPEIREIESPAVVTGFVGAVADRAWISWLRGIGDGTVSDDLPLLMSVRYLVDHGWADARTLAPYLQLSPTETAAVVRRLAELRIGERELVRPVVGQPPEPPDTEAHRLGAPRAAAARPERFDATKLAVTRADRAALRRRARTDQQHRAWQSRRSGATERAGDSPKLGGRGSAASVADRSPRRRVPLHPRGAGRPRRRAVTPAPPMLLARATCRRCSAPSSRRDYSGVT